MKTVIIAHGPFRLPPGGMYAALLLSGCGGTERPQAEERREKYYMTGAIAERLVKYMRIEGSRLLQDGTIDAFLDEGVAEAAFDVYGDVAAEDFLPAIYSPVSMTTQNPDLEPLISVVQKALCLAKLYYMPREVSK